MGAARELANLIGKGGDVKAGTLAFFGTSSAPTGYLKANGAAVSRTTYSALFDEIGTTYGSGDGSTTFNLPDLRGEFPRGWDDGRGVDSGRSFGSFQNSTRVYRNNLIPGQGFGGSVFDIDHLINDNIEGAIELLNFTNQNRNSGTIVGGQNATVEGVRVRPRNVALLACIKY